MVAYVNVVGREAVLPRERAAEKLAARHERSALTDAEFADAKAKLLTQN
jgi:hypothetical protein